jgi:hypothetical protein
MFEGNVGKVVRAGIFVGLGYYILRALGVFAYPGRWFCAVLIMCAIGWMLPDTDPAKKPMAQDSLTAARYAACQSVEVGSGDFDHVAHYCSCVMNVYAEQKVQHWQDDSTTDYHIRAECRALLQ